MSDMKKRVLHLSILALLALAGCQNNGQSSPSISPSDTAPISSPDSETSISSDDSSSVPSTGSGTNEQSSDSSLPPEVEDYGDPATWPGEKMVVRDLGDCIMDAYPYDDMYDWGQSIMFDEEDGFYKMWWCRQSGYDTIWYAESFDLKHWRNEKKILFVEEDTTWIKWHVGKPSVIKENGHYRMYFEAPATLNGGKEFDNNVFMAESDDGIHFDIYEGDIGEPCPIIRMSDADMADSWAKSQDQNGSGYGYYGIGQPSITKKGNTYYLYCTYSLAPGDRLYVFQSRDGVHFDEGQEAFLRAGSGVKYNLRTNKFMMAYELTLSAQPKVYYMESDDGVHFTYSDYTSAANNQNILSRGTGMTRSYPDFVSTSGAQVDGYTNYVAFMEGKNADAGQDWRQYCNTWDIHIAMFQTSDIANRPMTLPNGKINSSENIKPYGDKHVPYEDRLVGISLSEDNPRIDGVQDEAYANGLHIDIDRLSFEQRAVPSSLHGEAYLLCTQEALYVFVNVFDATHDQDDEVVLLLDEKRFAADNSEVLLAKAFPRESYFTDLDNQAVEGPTCSYRGGNQAYSMEFRIPWRFRTNFAAYQSFGFDCYIYDRANDFNFKSVVAWNDFRLRTDIRYAGEIYFR